MPQKGRQRQGGRERPEAVRSPVAGALIAGVDEAGRGALIGPVVAAAVILPAHIELAGLDDSKRLSAPQRQQLAERIRADALSWGIGRASAHEVDRLNVLQASLLAMRRALAQLALTPAQILVDGLHCPAPGAAYRAVVGGDALIAEISAASILAKVTRDADMLALHQRFPGYGLAQHKGYPTAAHRRALATLGPCPEHRRSFAPVRALV